MKVIGVTGGSGSGKSSFCAFMSEMGAAVSDADKISHSVIKRGGEAFDEVLTAFGENILGQRGEIDRKILGKIVFSDKEKLAILNRITHKHIFAKMRREIELTESKIILLDVPLLFGSGFPIEYDLSIAVTASYDVRIKRVSIRDKISEESAKARIASQMSDNELISLADICVDNSHGLNELKAKAARIYNIIVS